MVFALIVFCADLGIGKCLDMLREHARGGYTSRLNHIHSHITGSVIVMGSSRANHHYNPEILSEHHPEHAGVYNAGMDGNGILLAYMFLSDMLEYHTPKMVIYDVMPDFDYLVKGSNDKYLGWERPYYGLSKGSKGVFSSVSATEPYKMLSRTYRHNSKLPQYMSDALQGSELGTKGYMPMEGSVATGETLRYSDMKVDSLKLGYMDKFMALCKENGVKLVMCVSPAFATDGSDVLAPVRKLCNEYNVTLYNHLTDTTFYGKGEYFADGAHLNSRGADIYSHKIGGEIFTQSREPRRIPTQQKSKAATTLSKQ